MQLNITLKPHVGMRNDPILGEVEVDLGQYIIVAESEALKTATGQGKIELGYVGKEPGRPINFLPNANRFPENVQDAIAEEVKKKLAELQHDTEQARKTSYAPEQVVVDSALASGVATSDTAGDQQNL